LPISHDEELTIDDLVEMLKQSALEEAEPQPKDRTVTALKLTEAWTDCRWRQGV
jgi:hypothetical protein